MRASSQPPFRRRRADAAYVGAWYGRLSKDSVFRKELAALNPKDEEAVRLFVKSWHLPPRYGATDARRSARQAQTAGLPEISLGHFGPTVGSDQAFQIMAQPRFFTYSHEMAPSAVRARVKREVRAMEREMLEQCAAAENAFQTAGWVLPGIRHRGGFTSSDVVYDGV